MTPPPSSDNDQEREALARIIQRHRDHPQGMGNVFAVAEDIIAAGFRRVDEAERVRLRRWMDMCKEAGAVPVPFGGEVTATGSGGTHDDGTRYQVWNANNEEACRRDAPSANDPCPKCGSTAGILRDSREQVWRCFSCQEPL
jgi:hypothetical protein